jgi:hypothetical protein
VDVLTPVCSTHAPVLAEISFKTFKQRALSTDSQNNSHICKLEFGGLYITPTKNLSLLLFRISTQSISKLLIDIKISTYFAIYVLTPVCSTHAPDIEGLADELNITNWDDLVFNSDNINDVYSNFLKILDDAVFLSK